MTTTPTPASTAAELLELAEMLVDGSELPTSRKREIPAALKELAAIKAQQPDLQAIIERDRTLFADCVTRMRRKIASCHWMVDSRGNYEWDDKKYQDEFGDALEVLRKELDLIAGRAGDMSNSPTTQAAVDAARQQPSGDSGLAGFLKSAEGQRAIHEHVYWGAGEFGCPKEIKASNGELHTLMCKVCDRKGGDLEKYECWPAKSQQPSNAQAPLVGRAMTLDCYDAGLLNDYGGGNVQWWQDYMRCELARAHDFYQSQIDASPLLGDTWLLDAKVICIDGHDEFGETQRTLHMGIDLRKAIRTAIEQAGDRRDPSPLPASELAKKIQHGVNCNCKTKIACEDAEMAEMKTEPPQQPVAAQVTK